MFAPGGRQWHCYAWPAHIGANVVEHSLSLWRVLDELLVGGRRGGCSLCGEEERRSGAGQQHCGCVEPMPLSSGSFTNQGQPAGWLPTQAVRGRQPVLQAKGTKCLHPSPRTCQFLVPCSCPACPAIPSKQGAQVLPAYLPVAGALLRHRAHQATLLSLGPRQLGVLCLPARAAPPPRRPVSLQGAPLVLQLDLQHW